MKCSTKRLRLNLFVLCLFLTFFPWIASCANDAQIPKPPITMPFAVHKAGNIIDFEMQVVEEMGYFFALEFLFKDQEDRARVKKFMGESGEHKDGDPGVSTPLRLAIYIVDASGEHLVLEHEIEQLRLTSWGSNFFDKIFALIRLTPGRYRIHLESLKDAPEFRGTSVRFQIGRNAKTFGSTIDNNSSTPSVEVIKLW